MTWIRVFRTAAVAAGAVGAVGGLTGGAYGLLSSQTKQARQTIGLPKAPPHNADGVYLPDGLANSTFRRAGATLRFAVLGDSLAAGLGADEAATLPGVLLAGGLAEESGRPVRLTTYAVTGATTRSLPFQVDTALADHPTVALVIVGANDVTTRLSVHESARLLGEQVHRMREAGVAVVVGTCPDLGRIEPIRQPLRLIAHAWSVVLASAQGKAVERAGAVPVSLSGALGAEFARRRHELFSADAFHPNSAGYQTAAELLLGPLCEAAGAWATATALPGAARVPVVAAVRRTLARVAERAAALRHRSPASPTAQPAVP
jgi:lysophospholipase L1-like esterase